MFKIIIKTRTKFVLRGVIAPLILFAVAQTTQAQNIEITDDRPTISEAFQIIESQTGMSIHDNQSFDVSKHVDLTKAEIPLSQVMEIILRGTNNTYSTSDKAVSIHAPKSTDPPKSEEVRGVVVPTRTERIMLKAESDGIPEPIGNYQKATNLTYTPMLAVKSNLLYDATGTINVGAEYRIGEKNTIDIAFNLNAWDMKSNMKWKHILIQPEFRWWTCEPFDGHFLGVHGIYTYYNVGGLPKPPFSETMHNYRYNGWGAGIGISYGYHWILGKRWALEATIGLGWVHLNYDKYPCVECGRIIGNKSKEYFGPTKVGISLEYIIK